jgi:ring-1,2-phenylacetyl-CoA epoxidase subunit PaaD
MVTAGAPAAADVWRMLDRVVDPEIPVLTLADLGVLRDVEIAADGAVIVTITPTYSGCPALDTMRSDIRTVLAAEGLTRAEVRTVHQPAWTTDMMSEDGRAKLEHFGIAPPGPTATPDTPVLCPQCASSETRTVSHFGSTACKALMVCSACREPFDYFKAI